MILAVKKCLLEEAQALISLSNVIGEDLTCFLDKLSNCKGKLCFTGVGKSLIVANKIAASFSSIGYSATTINPLGVLHGDLGFLTTDDVVVAISNSGETDILVTALNYVQSIGTDIISITGDEGSTVARMSSCHCLVRTSEAGAFGLVPSSSTTAVMALGDALLCGLIIRDNLTVEDFLKYHPGGTLGEKGKRI